MAANPALTQQASRRRDDPVITGLVTRARKGEQQAWDALAERYAPLIWSICRRHRLEAADAEDAAQTVWLKLADQLDKIRDPAALPGWLATTTRRECGRIARTARHPCDPGHALAAGTIPGDHAQAAGQDLLAAERHAALREAFGQWNLSTPELPGQFRADRRCPCSRLFPPGTHPPAAARMMKARTSRMEGELYSTGKLAVAREVRRKSFYSKNRAHAFVSPGWSRLRLSGPAQPNACLDAMTDYE